MCRSQRSREHVPDMAAIVFSSSLPPSDPSQRPVTIIGKKANLSKVQYSDVVPYLGSRVSTEVNNHHHLPSSPSLLFSLSPSLPLPPPLSPFLPSSLPPSQTWSAAVGCLRQDGGSCSLWLSAASVAALPTKASRHNTPSQAHALTKLVQSERKKGPETAIIVSHSHTSHILCVCVFPVA